MSSTSMEISFQLTSDSSSCNNKTVGGGMGLSMHTPFRIATENTRVAMPEVSQNKTCLCPLTQT
jgi:3-hydroxyisobutyryl-CoA hydrolase